MLCRRINFLGMKLQFSCNPLSYAAFLVFSRILISIIANSVSLISVYFHVIFHRKENFLFRVPYSPSFHCSLNSQKAKNSLTFLKKTNPDLTIKLFSISNLEILLFIFHSKIMRINNRVYGKWVDPSEENQYKDRHKEESSSLRM